MARFLVTGGAGFIGSHLVEALVADGHFVRILDNLSNGISEDVPIGSEFMLGDVIERDVVRRALEDVEGCFHLAAIASVEQCRRDWRRSHQVNLGGTICVFEEACRAQHLSGRTLPVVYASSASVYGDVCEAPIVEDSAKRPASAYGVDKLGCELHAGIGARSHRLSSIGLRFFNVYGPRQDPKSPYSGVVSIFCQNIARGRPVEIHGDGAQVRDFVYVKDAVYAMRQAMDAAAPQSGAVFNVCTGIGTSIRNLAETVAQISGLGLQSRLLPRRSGDLDISVGDPRRASAQLRFQAGTPLDQGLRSTLAWLVEQPLGVRAASR